MQARYYDPVIGRFYSNDPVGYTASNPVMSFNRYLYVNNNPYKYVDPDGEAAIVAAPVAAGTAAVYVVASVGVALGCIEYCGAVVSGIEDFANWVFNESSENAAQGLPDLTGVDGETAEDKLEENGFGKTKTTKGGYEQWDHEDGSRVNVRPDGEVVRTGPKRPQSNNPQGKNVRDRYGPDGKPIPHDPSKDNHNTGEIIER